MFEIDKIPLELFDVLNNKGFPSEEIMLAMHSDRNLNHEPAETYLFATAKHLVIMTGIFTREGEEKIPARVWQESDYREYALDAIDGFRIEELLSSCRFTAKTTEGEPILLAVMTNFCRSSVLLFRKYLDKLKRQGSFELDPDDDPKSNCCPKCGHRYPNKNRKICPRCMDKGKLFRRIMKFFLKYKLELILSMISLIAMTGLTIWAADLSSGYFISEVLTEGGRFYGAVVTILTLLISVKVVKMLASIVNNYMTSVIAAKVNFDLKKTIFSAIERLSLSFFTSRQTGGLMTQVNSDANTIYNSPMIIYHTERHQSILRAKNIDILRKKQLNIRFDI